MQPRHRMPDDTSHVPSRWLGWSCCILLVVACADEPDERTCRDGFQLDEARQVCVPLPLRCVTGEEGRLDECAAEHRVCIDAESGASCGGCATGFTEEKGVCRAVVTCEALDCGATGRSCQPAGDASDASCGDCTGSQRDFDGTCGVANCQPGAPGSMAEGCAALFRTCIETTEGASCTACIEGYVDNAGDCVPVATCTELACAEAGRACVAATAGQDTRCGDCLPGRTLRGGICAADAEARCLGTASDPNNVEPECSALNRFCVADPAGARCGDCKAGFLTLADGRCAPEQSCEALDCGAQNRVCVSDPTGYCAGCMPGFVEDEASGACRKTKRCDCGGAPDCEEVTCAPRESCQEASDFQDATCYGGCGAASIWNGRRCEPCPPCTAAGERGRWPWPTATGNCICETEPGYYYSLAGDVGPFECDADGDGWVRESARVSLESSDPHLQRNARCDLRSISAFVLENEAGETRVEALTSDLELYETDRNDDDALLRATWDALGVPLYGEGTLAASAVQLNRLTKYCGSRGGDYNDNGTPDVSEWGSMSLGPRMRPEQAPFNTFSYFAELHTGSFEPSVTGSGPGRIRIKERSRLDDPSDPDRVALTYGVDGHWRACRRLNDAEAASADPPVGMDFAAFGATGAGSASTGSAGTGSAGTGSAGTTWQGMTHHSQFKCHVLVSRPEANAPEQQTPAELLSAGYTLQSCVFEAGAGGRSPAPRCTVREEAQLQVGQAVWSAVPYRDHDGFAVDQNADGRPECYALTPAGDCSGPSRSSATSPYVRGCVNECVAGVRDCPGYSGNPGAVACTAAAFGEKTAASCEAWELCDGLDNDGDGRIDDIINEPTGIRDESLLARDPRVGVEVLCDVAGLQGECRAGRKQCVRTQPPTGTPPAAVAAPACIQTFASRAESCDGRDEDCDGRVDEGFVGPGAATLGGACTPVDVNLADGVACRRDRNCGECAKGAYICRADGSGGPAPFCEAPNYQPVAETCGGGDEDCDSAFDELPTGFVVSDTCPATFNRYYRDRDGDGYPAQSDVVCACRQPAGYRPARSDSLWDCCDTSWSTRPGSQQWRTTSNACGHFNWNCSEPPSLVGEQRWTAIGTSSGCRLVDFSCTGGSSGWEGSAPACGQKGNYYDSCKWEGAFGGCGRKTFQRTQACR